MDQLSKSESTSISGNLPWHKRFTRFFPVLAFLGGFVWDSITLGKIVQSSDLWILFAYWVVAFLVLIILGRNPSEKWQPKLTYAVQFCFGSLFSALVVFYFKSSGSIYTFLFVLILAAILISNEFLKDRYSRLGVSWTLFCLSGTMYLNFLIPHVVHGVGVIWFLLSCVLGFAPVYALWRMASQPGRLSLIAPVVVSLALVFAWFVDVIPPVPMVMKQNIVCKAFEKIEGDYTCLQPTPGILERLGLKDQIVYHAPGEKLFLLSSVFGPSKVEVELEQRWMWEDPVSGEWQKRGSVPFLMRGGRESGWRLYSNKQIMEPGYWRVVTALKDGAEIGQIEFVVPEAVEPEGVEYDRVRLK